MTLISQDDETEDNLNEALQETARIVELTSDDENYEDVEDSDDADEKTRTIDKTSGQRHQDDLPSWLQSAALGLFHDDPVTATTEAQAKVTAECLPLLLGDDDQGLPLNKYGIPHLRRDQHVYFLNAQLGELPAPFQVVDASRPWLFYWSLAGLSFLGEDVSQYKDRLIETVRPLQNAGGGFGGGHGQLSHCACTYATTLALAVVGGLSVIDRKAMWHWLGSVKQADGGFRMAVDAEEDIRGAYCAVTIITLMNLPLELPPDAPARKAGLTSFVEGVGEWVSRCQTYEGGIGGSPATEARGAYAFCALACLSIIDAPHVSIPKYLDIDALAAWLAARQTQPEGGFQGRQEKLVDACYSHWVGGCWNLIQAAFGGQSEGGSPDRTVSDLWNREALIRYLLSCGQQPGKRSGMRDKPSTRPDAYHTCYSLAGLSHAQNHFRYEVDSPARHTSTKRLLAAFNWTASGASEQDMQQWKVEAADVVDFVHPVFVVPMNAVASASKEFDHATF